LGAAQHSRPHRFIDHAFGWSYTRLIVGILGRLKEWFGSPAHEAELSADGGEPVATGMGASIGEQPESERSTNAQVAGASDEPWPGNE
jgi:hypothetical protein